MRGRRTVGRRTAVHLTGVGLVVMAALAVPVYERLSARPAAATLETVALVKASIAQDYPPGCVPDELVSVEAIDATGRIAHPHVGDGLGRRVHLAAAGRLGDDAADPATGPVAAAARVGCRTAGLRLPGASDRPRAPGGVGGRGGEICAYAAGLLLGTAVERRAAEDHA